MADTTGRRLSASEKSELPTNDPQKALFYAIKGQVIPEEGTTSNSTSTIGSMPGTVTTKSVTNSGTNSVQAAPLKLTAPTDVTKPEVISKPVTQSSVPFTGTKVSQGNTKTADDLLKEDKFVATPNILNSYEQVSYQWMFFVGPDMKRTSADSPNVTGSIETRHGEQDNSKVVIAQSGLTSFNIQSVEIDSYVSPNASTLSQSATKFVMKIAEPFGASLPDKMFLAAQFLKVKNYLKCPYYLSLTFAGYDPESGAIKQNIAEKTWTWQIMITRLTTSLDEVGSVHTIEAYVYNDLASQNQYNVMPITTSIDVSDKRGTIGEVMSGIQDAINANIAKRYTGQPPYTVKIIDKPYPSTANSPVSSPFEHKIVSDTKHKDSSRNQGIFQVSRGTDISKVFEYLISSSDTGVSIANPSGGGANSIEDKDSNTKPMSVIHKVDTEVNIVGFDETRREYIREFVFIIRGYDNVRTLLSPAMQDQANQKAKEKLNHAIKRYLLNKEYNYLYTGKNTEVLNMDINLNFSFNIANNFYEGYYFTEMASPGIQFNQDTYMRQVQQTNWNKATPGSIKSGNVGYSGTPGSTLAENLSNDNVNNFPVSFIQDPADPSYQVRQGVESNNTRGRSIYGMILNQLYGTNDGNLVNLNLDVRGDPYWLGYDNTSDLSKKDGESDTKLPNFLNGEHMFFLRFFIPKGINEETGDPIFDVSDMYSGFYGVIQVQHTFAGGTFKQTLQAVRITAMEGSEILK